MENSRTEILRYLENIDSHFTNYSHHKETMAWAGVVLHVALATQIIGSLDKVGTTLAAKISLIAVLVIVSPITFFYIRQQFKLRRRGADLGAACEALTAEIISRPGAKLKPSDYALLATNDKNLKSSHTLAKAVIDRADQLAHRGGGAIGRLENAAYWIVILTLILAVSRFWIS